MFDRGRIGGIVLLFGDFFVFMLTLSAKGLNVALMRSSKPEALVLFTPQCRFLGNIFSVTKFTSSALRTIF